MNKMIISSDMPISLYTSYVLRIELHERPEPELPAIMSPLAAAALGGIEVSPLKGLALLGAPRYEKPSEAVYETLHTKLSAIGIFDLASDASNAYYALPTGLYFGRALETPETLFTKVQAIVDSVWAPNSVFIAQTSRWVGANLKKV